MREAVGRRREGEEEVTNDMAMTLTKEGEGQGKGKSPMYTLHEFQPRRF